MENMFYLFLGVAGMAALLASIAVWAPRRAWARFTAVAAVILILPSGYLMMLELLSKPKPMSYEWFQETTKRAIVLGIHFDEGNKIYLWLHLNGEAEPRYYAVPWRTRTAEQLQDGLEDAVRRGGVLAIDNPFVKQAGEDLGDLNVEIVPPAAPPQKQPRIPPRIIDPRGFNI